jgi:hypothetical protein
MLELVERHSADLVINFNPLHGDAGLVEFLAQREIAAIGSNQVFSQTEINKREFKQWLTEQEIPTPRVRFEGLARDVLARKHELDYPLVVKPDIQVGPQTTVIPDPDALSAYFAHLASVMPTAESGLIFLIEDCLPEGSVIQILYGATGGRGVTLASVKMTVVPKTEETPTGAVFAVLPWSERPRYQGQLDGIQDKIANAFGGKSIGSLQCMLGQDGILYVIENNARPAACCMYDPWRDPFGCVRNLLGGDANGLRDATDSSSDDRCYLAAGLIHPEPSVWIGEDRFKELVASGSVRPFSFQREEQGFKTEHGRMPSALLVSGSTRQEAADTFNQEYAIASSILTLLPSRANPGVFD